MDKLIYDLNNLKKQGNIEVNIDEVLEELQFIKSDRKKEFDLNKWKIKAQIISGNEQQLFSTTIKSGENAMKYLFFANGAACLTLLPIIASGLNLSSITNPINIHSIPYGINQLLHALNWFSHGLLCSTAGFGATYFCQLFASKCYEEEFISHIFEIEIKTEKYKLLEIIACFFLISGISFGIVSIYIFYKGLNCGVGGFLR